MASVTVGPRKCYHSHHHKRVVLIWKPTHVNAAWVCKEHITEIRRLCFDYKWDPQPVIMWYAQLDRSE